VADPDPQETELLPTLNLLLEANDKLNNAIDATREAWNMPERCWIDQLTEPTPLLNKHKLRRRKLDELL
jgi:hypothetical protein